ncbi:MAG: hypothetical protein M3076_01070 [Actinomycetota bacterium]|nr:hypothetical protein [Actinomycetota bacterium]
MTRERERTRLSTRTLRSARLRVWSLAAVVCILILPCAASAAAAGELRFASSAGSVVVSRSPFRLLFFDRAGGRVLSEVAAGARQLALSPPPRPLVPTFGPPLQGTLYSPLAFTIGTESVAAQASGLFAGNLLSVARTGTVYAARRVVAVSRSARGLRLVV